MQEQELRAQLVGWENLGPLRTIEELRQEMTQKARAAGAAAAPVLASTLVALERGQDSLLAPLLDFLDIYVSLFPDALAAALLNELGPDGPPNLVEVLGSTRSPAAVHVLQERINLEEADGELLVALACALGEIGGPPAIDMLYELSRRPALPAFAQQEVRLALESLGQPA